MNRQKLTNLLKVFTPDETAIDFSVFEGEIKKLEASLKEKVQATTLNDVNSVLEKNRQKINFEPLTQAFSELKQNLTDANNQVNQSLLSTLDEKISELNQKLELNGQQANTGDETLKQEIEALNAEIAILSARKVEIPDFAKQIKNSESKLMAVIDTAKTLDTLQDEKEKEELQIQFVSFEKQIKDLKQQFLNRGGGSMNRQIFISNADPLTRYTDINLKPGAGTTITYVNNNTTKKVDITITGGGSGSGITRSIASTSVSSTIGAVAATDYVVLATAGVQITLPTAVSNTNLYTIKNTGSSSVLVGTTGGQTIDGSTIIIMPVQFTSIDVISDSANWEIT